MPNPFVCIDGTVLRLTALTAVWGWGTSSPPTPTLGNNKDITVTGSGTKRTVNDDPSVIDGDLFAAVSGVTDSYHALLGGNYFNVSPLTAGSDGMVGSISLSGINPSTKSTHEGNGLILDNDTGTFTVTVTTPAIFPLPPPASGSPVPDVTPTYTGTWSILSNGGNTKFTSA